MDGKTIANTEEKFIQVDFQHHFIENGGFFPVILKHDGGAFIFCRTNAGHLGKYGRISMLESPNGIDWFGRGVAAKAEFDLRNPSVYIHPNGDMLLAVFKYDVYKKNGICSPSEQKTNNSYDIIMFHSRDLGKSWQKNDNVNFEKVYKEIGKVSPYGKMFLHKNRLIMPTYNKKGSFLLSSIDNGNTWDVFSQITDKHLEPFVINTKDGLVAVMRAGSSGGHKDSTLISHYSEKNNTWSKPLKITEALQHPADLLVLSNNLLLLTYSDRNINNQRILVKLSKDNGQSWSEPAQAGESFTNCDFGYPSTIELTEGILTTVFYANPYTANPYFYFNNPDLYETLNAKGYYFQYNVSDLINIIPGVSS